MTENIDHLDDAIHDVALGTKPGDRAAIAGALVSIAKSLRILSGETAPDLGAVYGGQLDDCLANYVEAEKASLRVPSLAHPSCRSATWVDNEGDRWRWSADQDEWQLGVQDGEGGYGNWRHTTLEPTDTYGPFTKVPA